MKYKICVITSEYLHIPMVRLFEELDPIFDATLVTYRNFKEIPKVYDEWANWADGFIVSGSIAKSAIEIMPHEILKPLLSFEIDMAGLYKELLLLLTRNRHQDTGRICMDFLVPLTEDWSANYFLADSPHTSPVERISQWANTAKRDLDTLLSLENYIKVHILRAYQNDQIDIVITQYTNLIPFYEDHHIPYEYPFPTKHALEDLLHTLFLQIEMTRLRARLPVIVSCAFCDKKNTSAENLLHLKETINTFLRENLLNTQAEISDDSVKLQTTLQIFHALTQNERTCALDSYLRSRFSESICIGYGYGTSLSDADCNARLAREESRLSGGSFICNDKGILTGPLNAETIIQVNPLSSEALGRIAKHCKLSALTIQKLVTYIQIAGSDKITTAELAKRFGVSIRNANRIIQNLEENGCASLAYTQTNGLKGRPVKVYQLDLHKALK